MASQHNAELLTFPAAVQLIKDKKTTPAEAASRLVAQLDNAEKVSLLTGSRRFWPGLRDLMHGHYKDKPWVMGALPRLDITGVSFCDGPRGCVLRQATCFPVAMARGASWDVSLEERVGEVIALESRAQGVNLSGALCINLPRHPSWGRIQETYGEDPIILGEFGIAAVKGTRKAGVMACVKHFALNSMEDARFKVDVTADDETLMEVYLAHFEMVVKEAEVECVMTSYNSVNGEWAGHSDQLLNQILKKQWGFRGFVISDWVFGLRDSTKSLQGGLDMEAPFKQVRISLQKDLESGKVSPELVEIAGINILRTMLKYYSSRIETNPTADIIFCRKHRDLAREVAAKSMVLLKNNKLSTSPSTAAEPLLPIDPTKITSCAVIGSLADIANTGDWGSSYVKSPEHVTPFAGIKAALSPHNVRVDLADTNDFTKAATAAQAADIAIVVVGYSATDEGENLNSQYPLSVMPLPNLTELARDIPPIIYRQIKEKLGYKEDGPSLGGKAGGDRKSLRLPSDAVNLIRAVSKANPRTIVAIIASGAVMMEEWLDDVNAVLMAWYSGCEGGHALADVLLGRVDAFGRLPFSIPKSEADLPFFDVNATKITYDKWFGQRLLDKRKVQARFPLGFGLSYTSFQLENLRAEKEGDFINVQVTVKNVGSRAGRLVVQVYGLPQGVADDFPSRVLLGFQPVDLEAGDGKEVAVRARTRPLQRWRDGKFIFASREAGLEVGAYAGDEAALKTNVQLE